MAVTMKSPQPNGIPMVSQSLSAVGSFVISESPSSTYPYSITGVTKDSTGAALPGVNVHLFHTADDTLVSQATSDASGNYTVPASNLLYHYIVAYLAGSPDVAGVTVNTLVGT